MVTIRKFLCANDIIKRRTSGTGNLKKKVCIHETDNIGKGANADAHARLQANGNSRQASWHYTVDDKEAVQSFSHDIKCWHAGTSKGNNEAIAIEICVNSDGDYKKAVQNAAELTAKILHDEKLTVNDVVQHNYYSGKNCPRVMRSGKVIPWSSFIQMVKANLEILNGAKETDTKNREQKKEEPKKEQLAVDGYWSKETTKALQRALNTPVDGVISGQYKNDVTKAINVVKFGKPYGSAMVKALQRKLNVKVDGLLGPQTIKALQRALNTPVDGKISKPSTMVKELQKRLNDGKL